MQRTNPAVALRVSLTPDWFTDGTDSGMARYEFGGELHLRPPISCTTFANLPVA